MAGKIAVKMLMLFLVLAALNVIYSVTLYREDLREKSPEIVSIGETADSTDIYYFGESSNVTFAETDSTKKPISALLADHFPGLVVTNINKYATHAGIYLGWLRALPAAAKLPKVIIVTMNLRSFDAAWIHSELETPLRESLVMAQPLPHLLNRFMLSLQAFDNKTAQQREKDMLREWRTTQLQFPFSFKYKTVAEWDYAMSQGSYLKADGTWDTDKIALACHYVKGYAFNLDDANPRVRDFDRIAAWSERHRVKIIFNLMAENVQYADSLVGPELVFLMRQNRDFLVKRYNRGNCRVVDNLEAVNGRDFIDQAWTTEHYDEKGRIKIANTLADTLKRVLASKQIL